MTQDCLMIKVSKKGELHSQLTPAQDDSGLCHIDLLATSFNHQFLDF
jgi:hypothetical protein